MSDDLHFSRSGTSHFGKLTTEVKTRLSEDEKADLMRASRPWPEKGHGRDCKGAGRDGAVCGLNGRQKQAPLSSARERLGGAGKYGGIMYENRQRAQGIAVLLRNFIDWIHETRIERAKSRMLFHDIQRRAACAEFTRLINARSPDRVARMEAERGLH